MKDIKTVIPSAETMKALAIENYIKNNQAFLEQVGAEIRRSASRGESCTRIQGSHPVLQSILQSQGYSSIQMSGSTYELRIKLY